MTNPTPTADAGAVNCCGGCVKCATYYFGGGHSDPAILAHHAAHLRAMSKGLREIWTTGNTERFLRATQKAMQLDHGNSTIRNTFALALTLVYGPTGLHKSWRNADGRPSAEALKVAEISNRIARAAAQIPAHLDTIDRQVENWIKDKGL